MPKCNFCGNDLPISPNGIYPEGFECASCGRPVDPETLLSEMRTDMQDELSIVQLSSGNILSIHSGQSIVLGREGFGKSIFQNKTISRKHCIIEWSSEGLSLCDLGSLNGTFVNGLRILGKTMLQGEEQLMLGNEVFLIKLTRQALPSLNADLPAFKHECPNCGYHSDTDLTRCPECGFGLK